jgi:hypothetical protein
MDIARQSADAMLNAVVPSSNNASYPIANIGQNINKTA